MVSKSERIRKKEGRKEGSQRKKVGRKDGRTQSEGGKEAKKGSRGKKEEGSS